MTVEAWIVGARGEAVAGAVAAVSELGGRVIAVIVGSRESADAAAVSGASEVRWFETAPDVAPEAFAGVFGDAVASGQPRVLLCVDDASSRVLLASGAARMAAVVLGSAGKFSLDGSDIVVSRAVYEGALVETLVVTGPVAAVYSGALESPLEGAAAAPVIRQGAGELADIHVTGREETLGGAEGLAHADRVVGAGLGVRSKDDLSLVDALATQLHAEIGCSLPLCDDMRWYDHSYVVGTSANLIAPDLYIALGISGQPQHMAGVRNAKVVVAINDDPDAPIFRRCDYGIVGDLYAIVPALTQALKEA